MFCICDCGCIATGNPDFCNTCYDECVVEAEAAFLRGAPIGSPARPAMVGGVPLVVRESAQRVIQRIKPAIEALD